MGTMHNESRSDIMRDKQRHPVQMCLYDCRKRNIPIKVSRFSQHVFFPLIKFLNSVL